MSSTVEVRSISLFVFSLAALLGVTGCSSNNSNNNGAGGSPGVGGSANAGTGGASGVSTNSATTNVETGGAASGGSFGSGGTTAVTSAIHATGGALGAGGTTAIATTAAAVTGGAASSSSSAKASGGTGGVETGGAGGTKASTGMGGVGGGMSSKATGGATGVNTGMQSGGRAGGGASATGGAKAAGGGTEMGGTSGSGQTGASSFQITSTELPDGGTFPKDATCESSMSSSQMPPLAWTGAPAGTKSFAMVFVDWTLVNATPPSSNGFHSAMWNIPATVSSLPQGLPAGSPPAGVAGLETVVQKKAPSGNAWLGPCPNFPNTSHTKTDTYEFRLYALNVESLPSNLSSQSIQQIYNYIEALPPLGVAILTGKSDAAATALK